MPYACPHMSADPAVRTRTPNQRPKTTPRTPLIGRWTGQPVAGAANRPEPPPPSTPGDRPGQQTIARHGRTSPFRLRVEAHGLHDVRREEYIQNPVQQDAQPLLQVGELRQVDGAPHDPCQKTRRKR